MAIICEMCDTENPENEPLCRHCGNELLTTNNSVAVTDNLGIPVLILKDMDLNSGREIKITDNCTIGREGDIEKNFFEKCPCVSRYHCRIHLSDGCFYVEHLNSASNTTAVNRDNLAPGIKRVLRAGDCLEIADKIFEISFTRSSHTVSENISDEISEPVEQKVTYVIACPRCGKEYIVDDEDSIILECTTCDEYDRKAIARMKAKPRYANR